MTQPHHHHHHPPQHNSHQQPHAVTAATGGKKAPSSVTDQTRKQANLRLLQRTCDPTIVDLLATATHVVLYDFDPSRSHWTKAGVEGSIFLTVAATPVDDATSHHHPSVQFALMVLNRNSAENFVMPVTRKLQMQHQEPYLIFKRFLGSTPDDPTSQRHSPTAPPTQPLIQGIWFHNAHERVQMAETVERAIQQLRRHHADELRHAPTSSSSAIAAASASSTTVVATAPPVPAAVAVPTREEHPPAVVSVPQLQQQQQQDLSALLSQTVITAAAAAEPAAGTHTAVIAPTLEAPPSSLASVGTTDPPAQQQHPLVPLSSESSNAPVALDKRSLQLALLSLLQDDRFLDLLHSQYLRVIKARAHKQQQQNMGHPPPS